ncbi:hypothetical protein VTN77DRAFT_2734 [Rasamsonia byssochlamydoides]|uniref:uncharacterized protein n=1 Tax=Rasamsonia byssochlamydoides TaxID=89139 RepID=UPI0037446427
MSSSSSSARGSPAAEFIRSLITTILNDLMDPNARASITIKHRFQRDRVFRISPLDEEGGGALGVTATGPEIYTTYSWPGKTTYETWKFSTSLRVISLIYGAIMDDSVITKRCYLAFLSKLSKHFILIVFPSKWILTPKWNGF